MNIQKFISKNILRGACICGKCSDAIDKPEEHQPEGHTVDLTFFQISLYPNVDYIKIREELKSIIQSDFPHYLDGKEHNYIEIGGDVGDQGLALTLIGAGHLLGLWKALSPDTMLPKDIPKELKLKMAGVGMVSLKVY